MTWVVEIVRRTLKQLDRLPITAREGLTDLIRDMELHGPARGNWPNYSRLSEGRHHCQIKERKACLRGNMVGRRQGNKTDRGNICRNTRKSTLLRLLN